jgi:hypothetical protein
VAVEHVVAEDDAPPGNLASGSYAEPYTIFTSAHDTYRF